MRGKSIDEKWKSIKGYEGFYEISNYGRVRSVDRVIIQRCPRGNQMVRNLKGSELTPTDNGSGYLIVGLSRNHKRTNFYIHRLVAAHFVGSLNDNLVVNHKDFDISNNYYKNLEVVTQKQNVLYSSRNMRKPRMTFNDNTYIRKRKSGFEVTVCDKYIGKYSCVGEARKARNMEMRSRADYFKRLGELYEKHITE